jgi:hypothetical protein
MEISKISDLGFLGLAMMQETIPGPLCELQDIGGKTGGADLHLKFISL